MEKVECLTRPTPTLRPPLRHGTRWRIISHLSLNYLSLVEGPEGADALREILALYDFADSPVTQSSIESIENVLHRRVVKRVLRDNISAICRGTEITIEFNEEKLSGGGVFLLASVLERFVALYSSLNSFTTLVARSKQREEMIRQWQPRVGQHPLL